MTASRQKAFAKRLQMLEKIESCNRRVIVASVVAIVSVVALVTVVSVGRQIEWIMTNGFM